MQSDPLQRISQLRSQLDDLRSQRKVDPEILSRTLSNTSSELHRIERLLIEKDKEENANLALADRRDYLEKIINSIGDPIHVKDRQHRVILVNDAACKLFDCSREDIVGRTAYELFASEEMADISWEKDEEVFTTGKENVNEETNTYAPDVTRTVLAKKSLYKDKSGNEFLVGITRDITESKKAEDALREARDYLENLIDYANAPIIVWDSSFRITRFNHAFERLTQKSSSEVLGEHLEILFPESSKARSLEYIGRTSSGERWEVVEIPILRADGSVRIVLWNSANIYDKDGTTILTTIAQGQDITERKYSEDAIKESERRLTDIIDFLPDATFVIDKEGRVIAWNRAIEAMTGIRASDILGKGDYEYAIPFYGERRPVLIDLVLQNIKEIEDKYAHVERRDRSLEGEAYMPNLKDGAVYLFGKAAVLYDSAGNVFGAIESIRDITERKRAEEALAQERNKADNERRRLKAVLDALPVGVFIVDIDGKIAQINEQAERIWCKSEPSIEVEDWRMNRGRWASSGDFIKNQDWPLYRSLNRGETIIAEAIEIERFDGSRGTILSSSAPIKDDQGKITGAVSVILDITERKVMEEELQKAKEAAEEAVRAKSEFLANMSHEIRTPLNAVVGLTGLLLSADLTAEQRDYVETVQSSGNSLLSVINDILDFSKIEGGKMELENRPFDLCNCLKVAADLVRAAAMEKGLTLTYILDECLPVAFKGDVTRLRQVLANLMSNAVKFTDAGKVEIRVTGKPIDIKEPIKEYELHFSIQDTGIGIAKEKVDRLFHSFSQIDSSITRKYGGTGLGLAISRRLVELMGGEIWVESQPGKGSTFHFTILAEETMALLPTPVDAPVQPKRAASRDASRQGSGQGFRQPRILIAEDNAINQKVAIQMLKRLGYSADVAANGREVLQALERQSYDIVLMDVQMPEMDGLEAAGRIRERWPKGQGPRIVAITAYALEGDRERCLAAGMDEYISKPIQLEELRRALENSD
jgi:PAS domain S-box-containing protein